jgi:hypothetical protein
LRYSAVDADEEPDRQPVRRQRRKIVKCGQPGCRREVENDGYGDWVHTGSLLYQCIPGDNRNRMAMPK